jgi:hypothetical protein
VRDCNMPIVLSTSFGALLFSEPLAFCIFRVTNCLHKDVLWRVDALWTSLANEKRTVLLLPMHAFYAAQHPRKYHLFVDRQEAGSAFRGSHDVGQGRQQMARSFVDVVDGGQSAERPARNWRWQQRPRA